MNTKKIASVLILFILPLNNIYADTGEYEKRVPVIYCTDLFHPYVDPDDHFDIACLYAIKEIEIKAIILDQGEKQKNKPGSVPISQLNHITRRNIPHAIGLSDRLKFPEDKGLWQAKEYQDGVELILKILKISNDLEAVRRQCKNDEIADFEKLTWDTKDISNTKRGDLE